MELFLRNDSNQHLQIDRVDAENHGAKGFSEIAVFFFEWLVTGQKIPTRGSVNSSFFHAGEGPHFPTMRWDNGYRTGLLVPPKTHVILNTNWPTTTNGTAYELQVSLGQRGVVVARQPRFDRVCDCEAPTSVKAKLTDSSKMSYAPALDGLVRSPYSALENISSKAVITNGGKVYAASGSQKALEYACIFVLAKDGKERFRRCEREYAVTGQVDLRQLLVIEPGETLGAVAYEKCGKGGIWGYVFFPYLWGGGGNIALKAKNELSPKPDFVSAVPMCSSWTIPNDTVYHPVSHCLNRITQQCTTSLITDDLPEVTSEACPEGTVAVSSCVPERKVSYCEWDPEYPVQDLIRKRRRFYLSVRDTKTAIDNECRQLHGKAVH